MPLKSEQDARPLPPMPRGAPLPGTPSAGLRERWDSYGLTHVPYRLLMLARMLDRAASITTRRGGAVTLAEWRVAANLSRLGETTVGALADYALVDRAEVSRASHALEARGLVARRAHPGSKAKKLLRLTEAGEALVEDLGGQRRDFYAYLLDGLDEDQRRQFDDLLLHLAIRVEHYDAMLHEPAAGGRA